MAVGVYEALEALFGASSSSATDEHVTVFLREGMDVNDDDADDNGVADELQESFDFCLKPDEYIGKHAGDPRVQQWEKIRDALTSTSSGTSTASTTTPDPDPAASTATPPTTTTAPPPPPAHARGTAAPLGVPVSAMSGTAPESSATTAPATTGTPEEDKVATRKGKRRDKKERKPVPPPPPRRVRGRGIPAATRRILASDRYQSFFGTIKTSADKLQSKDRTEQAQGRTEMAAWKQRARRYRDGQVRNTADDKNFGSLLMRLIQAFESNMNVSDPDGFNTNFVTGIYPKPAEGE